MPGWSKSSQQSHDQREPEGWVTAHNGTGSNVSYPLVDESEAQDMDDHVHHDQRQTPCPVGAPIDRIVDKERCENGLGKVHQDLLELDASQRMS